MLERRRRFYDRAMERMNIREVKNSNSLLTAAVRVKDAFNPYLRLSTLKIKELSRGDKRVIESNFCG